jgi:enamine deaminase RidA (YjgF/YER057c/UK114 family)
MTQREPTPKDASAAQVQAEIMTESGRLIHVAGMTAVDSQGEVVGLSDPIVQARQAFENLQHRLASSDATLDDIVKLTYYLTDIHHLPEVNLVAGEFIDMERPVAITAVQITGLLRPEFLLQIEATAFVPLAQA